MSPAPLFRAHQYGADMNSPSCIETDNRAVSGSSAPFRDVSEGLQEICHAAQAELDDCITEISTLSALAEDAGNIETAKEYARRMQAAISTRTPEHIARLEREAWQRIDDSSFDGAWAMELARRNG